MSDNYLSVALQMQFIEGMFYQILHKYLLSVPNTDELKLISSTTDQQFGWLRKIGINIITFVL